MKIFFIIIILVFLISGCVTNQYSNEKINNPPAVSLPLENSKEAAQYTLSLEQVHNELNNPVVVRGVDYNKYSWWAEVIKTSYNKKEDIWLTVDFDDTQPVWIVNWRKGPSKCGSPYGCQIIIASDGTILKNISCNDGWNCK